MKLYTRSEIIKMLDFFQVNDDTIVQFIDKLTPIELPSDEEIMKAHDAKEFQFISFWAGAAWCRNQILNQKK